jgi:hypothetical protein
MMTFAHGARRLSPASGNAAAGDWRNGALLRLLAPFALIPLGTIYCQIHEIFFEDVRSTVGESLLWALATLLPWVVATLTFEWRVMPGEARSRLVRRALFLGIAAYVASSAAAVAWGAGSEDAFYSRLPLLAVALLGAAIYPIPEIQDFPHCAAANENHPPVAPTEILYASAAGNYVELHAGARTIIWRQTMQNAERILGPAGFVRVHRSYLVPWRSIERVAKGRKGPIAVALHNGRRLPVSTRYAANLRDEAA